MAQKNVSDAIAKAIEASSLTQGQIAERLGVQQGTISKWKLGTTTPEPGRFAQIEQVLEMSAGTLMDAWIARARYSTRQEVSSGGYTTTTSGEADEHPDDLEAEEQLSTLRDLTRGMSREDVQRLIDVLRLTRDT